MKLFRALLFVSISSSVLAQENRIDNMGEAAPELAHFGSFTVGVRTLELLNPQQVDVGNSVEGEVTNYYDRRLTVEIWYPATLTSGQVPGTDYQTETRNTAVTATLHGRALRDAAADTGDGSFPLVILSHGYPGNRFLMSHLGENLASKGYVVASIDHAESTYLRQEPIANTLYNRPLDQRFVLEQVAQLNEESGSFLHGIVDVENTALIGFSMGGYGLLNNIGAAINPSMITAAVAPPNELLKDYTLRNRRYKQSLDPRFKAAVAIAPWGMNTGFFTADTLQGVETPVLFVAGSVDRTAGYGEGTRAIFENSKNADRYLLTFVGGGHSVAAPIPVPVELLADPELKGVGHYKDAAWDSVQANNILQHFVTAFLDLNLKHRSERAGYLQLIPDAEQSAWQGFSEGAATGLLLEHKNKGE